MEFIAASWWFWILLALFSFLSVGINWILVTYGTAIDVGAIAYKASQLKKEDLPQTKEEFKDVAKDRTKSYVVARATSKVRKIFFGIFMMGLGALSTGLFLVTLLVNATLWLTIGSK